MNHLKDKKPSRPDIQEILSRMKNRFINEANSDNDESVNEENLVTTSVVESTVKEIPVEKSPDDEIAELMLQLNGQVDEELVASIRSRKKMYENQSEVDSTSTTNNSDETEQEKPRIILTLRPNENKPDSYVSSSNLTDYSSNSPKKRKLVNDVNIEVPPLKRSSRRSNDSNQSVLKSAIARKERTFSIDENSKKRLPKKIKKEPEEIRKEITFVSTQLTIENENESVKNAKAKEDLSEENVSDQKKKKKKFFRGGRYNIFKKKSLQKERPKSVKTTTCKQINSDSGNVDIDSSETNSERHSASVCSDMGTLMSCERNFQDDLDTSLSTIDVEDKMNESTSDVRDKEFKLCLCHDRIQVIIVDEGKITCKAEDCIDGKLIVCKKLAFHLDEYGNMPMLRANVALPFSTYCEHHMKRFFLHHCCPQCGKFCSEGIFLMCKNKHFSHIGCQEKDKDLYLCLHCGITDVYDVELKRHVIKHKNKRRNQNHSKDTSDITVVVGNVTLTTSDCPPEIDKAELSKHLLQLKEEIANHKRTMYSVLGLYQACEANDIKKFLSILGAECNLSYKFPNNRNRTALHVASSKGHLMLVYLLLQSGVDPNLVDNKMKSPLRMAAKFGHSQVLRYLINFDGAPEIRDVQGMTSLHLAAKNGQLECCKVILNKRPSMVNWKDNGGWTPLVWACENSYTDVVKFFITHKPNTRVPDDENNVALHWAAISGCLGVVKSLVEYDSEVNMLNDAGDTALHIAARKNAIDIVSYLLEKGAMAWHKNKGKKRPIDCCLPNSKCYNLLKNIPPEQRKPVTVIKPLVTVNLKSVEPKLKVTETPVFVKSTPVLISEDITHGCEDVPIRCVNEIDDEVPVEFTYIKENCYDVGNYVDSAMSHIASCNCEGACNTSDCKCVQANGDCLYDENGRLNSDFDYFNPSVILYECNWRCRCHKQRCGNRVIQKGIKVKLELYKLKDMGWGVRAKQAIPRGTFVCEYIGEIITDQKANDLKEDSYLFNLENPGATELFCIDAFNYSNVSRFINHSCDPNLMSVRSFINHHDKRFPRIAFFAVQDIKEDEQLSYDYGTTFWKVKGGLFTCKCGKSNCSFSEETIKSLHIDSDNEETELIENAQQNTMEKFELSNDELSNQDIVGTNELNSNLPPHKTKLYKNNNLLEQSNIKELNNIFTPKNGLPTKNKFNNSNDVKEEKNKNKPKQILKISDSHSTKNLGPKLIQNKLQRVMLNKKLGNKLLNGNLSPAIGKKVLITRKKPIETMEKDNISNGSKISLESIQSINNKGVTTYVLRPKVLSSKKKVSVQAKTEDTVPNDKIFKSESYRHKRAVSTSSDTSSCNHKILDSNDCDDLMEFIKNEPIDIDSDTEVNVVKAEYEEDDSPETLCASSRKFDGVIPGKVIEHSFNKEYFPNTDQDSWTSIDSYNEV